MKRLLIFGLLFLGLCSAKPKADTLLVITESTARGYLGPLLPQWVQQIKSEGRFTRVIVREAQRYTNMPGTSAQRWASIAIVSNLIARHSPDAVQFIGALPFYLGGSQNMDGHYARCMVTDGPYCATNLVFTDLNDFGMGGGDYLASNIPGDGRFDEIAIGSTNFARPVARVDAYAILNSGVVLFTTGCLSNLAINPVVDEAAALRSYFTNNLAFRRGQWSVSASNFINTSLYSATDYAIITNYVRVPTVYASGAPGAGARTRFFYHNFSNEDMNGVYDASCAPIRALLAINYRSFGMEVRDITGYGNPMPRWLFPGRTTEPYALVTGWSRGSGFFDAPFWLPNTTTNTHIADIHRSSMNAQTSTGGDFAGYWPFFYSLFGDLTLPLTGATTNQPIGQIGTIQQQ